MHTAVHGLFIFETKTEAKQALKILNELEYNEDIEDEYTSLYEYALQDVYSGAFEVLEEIDYREIPPVMDIYKKSKVKIINDVAVDIY